MFAHITGSDIANMILDQSFDQLYDDNVVSLCCLGILQLVILGVESRRVIPDSMLRLSNDRVAWDKYPWGSYVWPTLYSQLRNANVKRWSPLYVAELTNEDDVKTYSIFGYTWAFKGGPSSFQGHVNNSYFNMGTPPNFQTPMLSQPGSSVWQRQMPVQSATQYWQPSTSSHHGSYYSFGRVPSHMGRQNLQTTIETHDDVDGIFDQNIPNRGKREQFPSKYKLTPFMEQPPTIILPKQRVNKTKNKGKKANLSPLNLGGAFEDDNVEENNVTFLGSQFTGAERKLIRPVVHGTVPDRSFRVTFKSPRAFGEQDLMIETTCSSFPSLRKLSMSPKHPVTVTDIFEKDKIEAKNDKTKHETEKSVQEPGN
ncbi:hypothetical protein Tco_0435315 [Tanacetum coccineum]